MISLFPYNISIALQWAENIAEMTIQYNLSIALQRAEKIVEITHISIALQRTQNIVEMTGNFLEQARVSHRAP